MWWCIVDFFICISYQNILHLVTLQGKIHQIKNFFTKIVQRFNFDFDFCVNLTNAFKAIVLSKQKNSSGKMFVNCLKFHHFPKQDFLTKGSSNTITKKIPLNWYCIILFGNDENYYYWLNNWTSNCGKIPTSNEQATAP